MRSFTRSTAMEYWMRSLVPMREEIDLAGEQIGGDGGARDLDHGADFHLLVERDSLGAQLGLALLEDAVGAAQFLDAGDHRDT